MQTEEKVELEVLSVDNLKPIVEWKRFAILCVGCFGLIAASFGYAYNLISGDLQKILKLSSKELTAISTCGFVFQYLSLPYAFIYDYLGPVPVACLAIFYYALGALLMALTTAETIKGSVVRLCVFNAINNHGMMLYDMSGCVTVLSHFPTMRGLTGCLLKSYVGLGSSIVGTIQLAFFADRIDHFFYFLMAYAIVAGGLIICFTRLPPYHLTGYEVKRLSPEEKRAREATIAVYLRTRPPMGRFAYGYAIILLLIVYLPTQSCVVAYKELGKEYKIAFAVVTIIITLCNVFIFFPSPLALFRGRRNVQDESAASVGGVEPVQEDEGSALENKPVETDVDYIAPQYKTSFLRNLLTLRLWCIAWTLFCLTGAEITIILNASYVYGAIDRNPVEPSMRTLLSTLNGVGSAIGRLIMAGFEHLTQHRPVEKRIPITWAPFIPIGLMVICMILFLTLPAGPLPIAYVLCALANGAQAAQTLLVARTIFARDAAKHYNFCFLATLSAGIVCLPFLYGEWYYQMSLKTGGYNGYCFGRECVMMPFLVLLGLVVTSVASATYVTLDYTHFCKRALAERRRLRHEDEERVDGDVDDEMLVEQFGDLPKKEAP
ncbi:hypothetical protein AGDE_12700 [Angomonas deanei]|uniref:Nodulin-like, putative n=1 Tax=Angomonas deanei TaxID=59799 RepID=A0A7G2C7T7_9TRYP|nr:hypothetical protein AGDE_12700 [Angomonas deanei]CAD2215101.1 Nodulin-like, putative [Angomonas deanei]|eukprot:EPY23980.1 hypothetical protein AGDE_12700 [Angomonas deanei]